ncbi:MAG: hypothetical protein ACI8XB_000370 [Patiriisocius sp.]|jgi:hypothetical protein
MMKNYFRVLMIAVLGLACSFKNERVVDDLAGSGANSPKHDAWSALLKANVTSIGNVDYQGISGDERFEQYLNLLMSSHPDDTWTKNERMAFWINAYNAFTVKLINDNWPVKSIKDISNPWGKSFIQIENATYSLEDIEHKILRKKFDDPRIHFAINCASVSCPKLQNYAFIDVKLNAQLEESAVEFMNDPVRNVVTKDNAQISKIFDWFKGDFTKNGSLKAYINKYSKIKVSEEGKLSYMDYNWKLNK